MGKQSAPADPAEAEPASTEVAQAPAEAHVCVALECADPHGKLYVCHMRILPQMPLQDLVDKWVAAHGGDTIKRACLEHPDKDGEIDLAQTLLQLGWKAGDSEHVLWVVPGDRSQEAPPVPQVTTPQESPQAEPAELPKDQQAEVAEARKKQQAEASEAPKKRAKQCSRIPSELAESGDDAIEFVQPNPKRAGSSSAIRYALYMTARTVNEALQMGAAKGDIYHDFHAGWLTRRT